MKSLIFGETDRIIHHLMLNTYFMPDLGLFHGQMGVVLVMYECSRRRNNKIYFDVASYLLDNIMEKIDKNLTYSFATGLSGIGWGIEYLIQQGFVEGDSVEICEEIDMKIMETDPVRIMDLSLDTGLEGLLHYVIYHLQGAFKQETKLPFDDRYLSGLHAACIQLKKNTDASINRLLDTYMKFHVSRTCEGYNSTIIDFITPGVTELPDMVTSSPLGLQDGLSGKLLKIITTK